MGRLTFDAARAKDYPVVMGVVVLSSALLLASYLLRDIAYGVVDPTGESKLMACQPRAALPSGRRREGGAISTASAAPSPSGRGVG